MRIYDAFLCALRNRCWPLCSEHARVGKCGGFVAARANATKAHLDLYGILRGSTNWVGNIRGNQPSISQVNLMSIIDWESYLVISTTSFFVDGEKKAEFTGTFSEDYLLLRGTNENDVSFDTYLDNVRVLLPK